MAIDIHLGQCPPVEAEAFGFTSDFCCLAPLCEFVSSTLQIDERVVRATKPHLENIDEPRQQPDSSSSDKDTTLPSGSVTLRAITLGGADPESALRGAFSRHCAFALRRERTLARAKREK